MAEFTVDGHAFVTRGRIKPLVLNRIVLKLLPAAADFFKIMTADDTPAGLDREDPDFLRKAGEMFIGNIGTLTKTLAAMPGDDVDFVMITTLAGVQRRLPAGGLQPLLVNGEPMDETIDLGVLYAVMFEVLRENMGPFLASLARLLGGLRQADGGSNGSASATDQTGSGAPS